MAWLATFTFQLGDFPKTRALETEGLRICRERGFPIGSRDHLCGLGIVTKWSDGPAALRMISEAIAIGETLGDKLSTANDYHKRAFTYLAYGEIDRADDDLARMFDILAESPDAEPVRGYAAGAAGWIAGLRRDYALAERLSHEAVDLASEQGIAEMQTWSLRALGEIAFAKGELDRAAGCYQEALRLAYRSALRIWEGFCYANLAAVAFRQGDRRRAALLFGAADANWEYLGIVPAARVGIVAWSHQGFPPAEAMADTRFAANFAAGKQLSRAEVYVEAMAVGSDQDAAPDRGTILSVRQLEVLQQMSEGHTNREIAEALFVSKRTIDGHVASILAKLDVGSRRAAVAEARNRQLLND
jgi:non-specific serine/threonine protein kinase